MKSEYEAKRLRNATITVLLVVLTSVIGDRPLPLRTLVIAGMMVVALTWFLLPNLNRTIASWVRRECGHRRMA